ncbi:MAG: hypothetical protein H9882_07515 [Candidatus Fournierella pullistercoris]|uniref:DUF2953 domain-containing protein n=1 Tax=Candidatus Allofournierella pullistercoris TaxID=2838597 RepID=A0A948T3J7_9FIRM|nr:hypothetical protein [Candidatus Fournierella pullistercoris]
MQLVLAVILFLLKLLGWCLLAVLVLLLAVLLVPVTVQLDYQKTQFSARLRILFWSMQLYPFAEKEEQPPKKERKKPFDFGKKPPKTGGASLLHKSQQPAEGVDTSAEQQAPQSQATPTEQEPSKGISASSPEPLSVQQERERTSGPEKFSAQGENGQAESRQSAEKQKSAPEQSAAQNKQTSAKRVQSPKSAQKPNKANAPDRPHKDPETSWILEWIQDGRLQCLVSVAAGAIRKILWGIRVHDIRVYLPIYRPDAASTAIRVGQARAVIHSFLGLVQNFFRMEFRQLDVVADYTGQAQQQESFHCKLTAQLITLLITAIWALYQLWHCGFLKTKKR